MICLLILTLCPNDSTLLFSLELTSLLYQLALPGTSELKWKVAFAAILFLGL